MMAAPTMPIRPPAFPNNATQRRLVRMYGATDPSVRYNPDAAFYVTHSTAADLVELAKEQRDHMTTYGGGSRFPDGEITLSQLGICGRRVYLGDGPDRFGLPHNVEATWT